MGFTFEKGYQLEIEIVGKKYTAGITGTTHEDVIKMGQSLQEIAKGPDDQETMDAAEAVILEFLDEILGEDAVDEIVDNVPKQGIRAIHLMALAQYVIKEINTGGVDARTKTTGAPANNRAARRQAERASRRANKAETKPALVK